MKNSNIDSILDILACTWPDAACELNFSNPFELLIATVLSAQTTDRKVNLVTADLFKNYPSPQKMLELSQSELEERIKTIGLFRVKSKNILEICKILVNKYDGKVPSTFEELVLMPGVGRKTAGVVLANAFGIPAFPVDTHVLRVAFRLGLTASSDPFKVEKDLTDQIPENTWIDNHHRFISHGRRICSARKPNCDCCPLSGCCPTFRNVSS